MNIVVKYIISMYLVLVKKNPIYLVKILKNDF